MIHEGIAAIGRACVATVEPKSDEPIGLTLREAA